MKNVVFESLGFYRVLIGASKVVLVVKNLPANVGGIRDVGLIPGSVQAWRFLRLRLFTW